MTKQEIIEAINSTMVGNGIKGITAESLRLILTAIAENAGGGDGGSGDGAVRIMVPDQMLMLSDEFIAAGEFSPTVWDQIKEVAYEQELDMSLYDEVFSECFAHNAEVYQTLISKMESNEGTYVILDQSLSMYASYKIMIEYMIGMLGSGSLDSVNISFGQLAMCGMINVEVSDADAIQEIMGIPEGKMLMFSPISSNEYLGGYPMGLLLSLLPDGTILFDNSATAESAYVYIPYDGINSRPSNDVVLSSNFMSHNANLVSNWNLDKIKNIEYIDSSGASYALTPRVLYSSHTSSEGIVEYWDGYRHKLYRSTISTDGSVNTIELASISTTQVSE